MSEAWRDILKGRIPGDLGEEIDVFETQIELRKHGKLDEKIFGETRLRRGVYGQRYDNGQRNDGTGTKELAFPSGDLTKGPDTVWDAPGMQRIKLPWGGITPEQMEVFADLAEEVSDGISHVTTRQDIQLHYTHIDDMPDLMRRLAAVGITTREACGNSVRNVTGCPLAGVCRDESFDVTPYAEAITRFFLGHPDVQDFGRKFKIAFSGCAENACGLVNMHDLGFIARKRTGEDGAEERGFSIYVGGGLGAVPHEAKILDTFVPLDRILPRSQAVARVFARLGEKRNRARARIKFLVAKLGIEEFRRLVDEEESALPADERWTALVADGRLPEEKGGDRAATEIVEPAPGFGKWRSTNVVPQRQPGYVVATVSLPLGDATSPQLRALADVTRRYAHGNARTTVEQNVVLRWVHEEDLPALHRDLVAADLGRPGAGRIGDVTACPGTDTCKLGIASSRGLARELERRMNTRSEAVDPLVAGLRIKISGCFNSCAQHHVADLGFYGVSRKIQGTTVPHFQVVLGGKWSDNAGSYGLAIGAVPSRRIPDVVDALTKRFVEEREDVETFQDWVRRIGKTACRDLIEPFQKVPPYEEDRSYFSDWGDPREFTVGDMGKGECAGEVVSLIDFDFAAAERQVFEAQVALDDGDPARADELAYRSMLEAARGLVKTQWLDVPEDPAVVVREFESRFVETKLFWDRFAGAKFASYLLRRHADGPHGDTPEKARQSIEEAQLFIEGAHSCNARLGESTVAA